MQKCIKCKEEKEITEFHKNRIMKNGYALLCKSCMSQYWRKKEKYDSDYTLHGVKKDDYLKMYIILMELGYDIFSEKPIWIQFAEKHNIKCKRKKRVDRGHPRIAQEALDELKRKNKLSNQ